MKNLLPSLLFVGGLVATTAAPAQNLLVNGGFEQPAVAAGSYSNFLSGSTGIPGWTVLTGAGAGVSVASSSYTDRIAFPAQEGSQWLDLTGDGFDNPADGVQQVVATVPGHQYALSYFLGNVSDPLTFYGTTSTVLVLLDGSVAFADVNSTASQTTLAWQPFTHTFTASASSTTIGFRNGDPASDNSNGLDNVVLLDLSVAPPAAAVAAPALSTWSALTLLTLLALGGAWHVRFRHGRRARGRV